MPPEVLDVSVYDDCIKKGRQLCGRLKTCEPSAPSRGVPLDDYHSTTGSLDDCHSNWKP